MEALDKATHPLRDRLKHRLHSLSHEIVGSNTLARLELGPAQLDVFFESIVPALEEDLLQFAAKDPAASGGAMQILESYASFEAVLHYRLAHALLHYPKGSAKERAVLARAITEQGKVSSGVDIHPGARIGRRFVLDHAIGTVIGETCEIGDDCYVLGGVTLGATGISGNPLGKRHPTLGNNVQVGAYARVFGPVTIGDNVFISANAVVTTDIAPDSQVTIVNQVQLNHRPSAKRRSKLGIFGFGPVGNEMVVFGKGFKSPRLMALDEKYQPIPGVFLQARLVDGALLYISRSDSMRGVGVRPAGKQSVHLQVTDNGDEVVLVAPRGLSDWLNRPSVSKAV